MKVAEVAYDQEKALKRFVLHIQQALIDNDDNLELDVHVERTGHLVFQITVTANHSVQVHVSGSKLFQKRPRASVGLASFNENDIGHLVERVCRDIMNPKRELTKLQRSSLLRDFTRWNSGRPPNEASREKIDDYTNTVMSVGLIKPADRDVARDFLKSYKL